MAIDEAELLSGDEFEDEAIEGIDRFSANLSGKSFYQCEFRNVLAVEADLSECVLQNCRLERCDLTMAVLKGASLRGVRFVDCKLMGIDWSPAGGLTFAVGFERCVLSHGTFSDLRMKQTRFIECKAHETNFVGVDLTEADFNRTDLTRAKFIDTNLLGADLSTAVHYEINPENNVLRKTRFSMEAALALASRMGVIVGQR